ncbi:hypothetical protein [Candidatus Poseidonia alphae]|uniref:hypothetical protein n=1 Tax=Candidatus Poseidonia alphae TaxID=1915863 RepID=UPI0030C724E9
MKPLHLGRFVRRKKAKVPDEAQSSLDRFSGAPEEPPIRTPAKETIVPVMPDLDLLEQAENKLSMPQNEEATGNDELRRFRMPSSEHEAVSSPPTSSMTFHDLDLMYPNAPVPVEEDGMVMHNATLHDVTGCHQLMDWVAEGHGCIVEMKRLIKRKTEFTQALNRLHTFIEGDLHGQIIQMTETRLMLLPEGCRGLKGTEMEGFAVDRSEFTDVN